VRFVLGFALVFGFDLDLAVVLREEVSLRLDLRLVEVLEVVDSGGQAAPDCTVESPAIIDSKVYSYL
tara:strand:+ start:77 stop:277 length:201 start_codon:yes stop_codon:yes gene_type:complete